MEPGWGVEPGWGMGTGWDPGWTSGGQDPVSGEEVWVPGGNLLLTTQVLTHKPHDTQ